jgi:hypothetical protein
MLLSPQVSACGFSFPHKERTNPEKSIPAFAG